MNQSIRYVLYSLDWMQWTTQSGNRARNSSTPLVLTFLHHDSSRYFKLGYKSASIIRSPSVNQWKYLIFNRFRHLFRCMNATGTWIDFRVSSSSRYRLRRFWKVVQLNIRIRVVASAMVSRLMCGKLRQTCTRALSGWTCVTNLTLMSFTFGSIFLKPPKILVPSSRITSCKRNRFTLTSGLHSSAMRKSMLPMMLNVCWR